MRPEERDLAYLWDMREASLDVIEFIKGVTFERFSKEKMLRYAVERRMEVIGEAARHVSETFQREHPQIPWARIIGQRNILAHEYGKILIERVWRTANENIPELFELLKQMIPAAEDE